MEFIVDNLEDMCALMCDNVIPKGGKHDKSRSDGYNYEQGCIAHVSTGESDVQLHRSEHSDT